MRLWQGKRELKSGHTELYFMAPFTRGMYRRRRRRRRISRKPTLAASCLKLIEEDS